MLPRNHRAGAIRPRSFSRGMLLEYGVAALPPGLQYMTDTYSFKVLDTKKAVVEGKGGRDQNVFRVTGLFQEADKENANGRIYPRDVLAEAVKAIQEEASQRKVMGEFDHPPDAKLHLDRVSHLITKTWMEGNKVYGEAEVLDSQPFGACLRGLFEQKVEVGISSRGVGDMEVSESGGNEVFIVLEGYNFVTWDAVADPSVSGAQLRQMNESIHRKLAPMKRDTIRGRVATESYERELLREFKNLFR